MFRRRHRSRNSSSPSDDSQNRSRNNIRITTVSDDVDEPVPDSPLDASVVGHGSGLHSQADTPDAGDMSASQSSHSRLTMNRSVTDIDGTHLHIHSMRELYASHQESHGSDAAGDSVSPRSKRRHRLHGIFSRGHSNPDLSGFDRSGTSVNTADSLGVSPAVGRKGNENETGSFESEHDSMHLSNEDYASLGNTKVRHRRGILNIFGRHGNKVVRKRTSSDQEFGPKDPPFTLSGKPSPSDVSDVVKREHWPVFHLREVRCLCMKFGRCVAEYAGVVLALTILFSPIMYLCGCDGIALSFRSCLSLLLTASADPGLATNAGSLSSAVHSFSMFIVVVAHVLHFGFAALLLTRWREMPPPVEFSAWATIHLDRTLTGKPSFQFRIANLRDLAYPILQARVHVAMSFRARTEQSKRRFFRLPLVSSEMANMWLSWTVSHVITSSSDDSPLLGQTWESLANMDTFFSVVFSGVDSKTMQPIYVTKTYPMGRVLFDAYHEDMVLTKDGCEVIDFDKFHYVRAAKPVNRQNSTLS